MNTDIIKGNWQQLKGDVKQKWARLTDDDVTFIEGSRDKLLGRIQERYGIERDAAETQVKEFEKKWDSPSRAA